MGELIKINRSKDWADLVLEGWIRAASRFRDPLAEPLLTAWMDRGAQVLPEGVDWSGVSDVAVQNLATRLLNANPNDIDPSHPSIQLLPWAGARWSTDLTHAMLHRLKHGGSAPPAAYQRVYYVASLYKEWASRVPPNVEPDWMSAWRDIAQSGTLERQYLTYRDLVNFRKEMLQRLNNQSNPVEFA